MRILLSVALLTASGCGGGDDEATDTPGSQSAPTAAATASTSPPGQTAVSDPATAFSQPGTSTKQNSITFVELRADAASGDAFVVVQTEPNAECDISYRAFGVPTDYPGLEPKTADASGMVRWEWNFGAGAEPRSDTVRVKCGDASASETLVIQ